MSTPLVQLDSIQAIISLVLAGSPRVSPIPTAGQDVGEVAGIPLSGQGTTVKVVVTTAPLC
jgi:hypothetical protein